jgi:hypothetical protein
LAPFVSAQLPSLCYCNYYPTNPSALYPHNFSLTSKGGDLLSSNSRLLLHNDPYGHSTHLSSSQVLIEMVVPTFRELSVWPLLETAFISKGGILYVFSSQWIVLSVFAVQLLSTKFLVHSETLFKSG